MPTAITFSLVYLLTATIAMAAAAVVWPRRQEPGGAAIAYMLAAAALWALCDAIELHLPSMEGRRFISQIQYFGVVSAAPWFFHAAMDLAGYRGWLTRQMLVIVWGIPIVSLVMAWTSQWHQLLWIAILPPTGDLPFSTYEYGWWFWVLTAQHYLLMLAATSLLLRSMRRVRRQFRVGMAFVVVALALPWVGNAAYISKVGPWPGLNWLTLSLGVSGSLLVWVVLREGLLDLLPRARDAMVDRMTDAMLVLDSKGQLLFANQSARDAGLNAATLTRALGLIRFADLAAPAALEAPFGEGNAARWLDVRVDVVRDRWGAAAGHLIVARDVTLQKSLEDEREHLIDELQAALRQVTQLEGLLPICAHCRKIRDDRGDWGTVEAYVGQRAPVEFTHAICPECADELYPTLKGS